MRNTTIFTILFTLSLPIFVLACGETAEEPGAETPAIEDKAAEEAEPVATAVGAELAAEGDLISIADVNDKAAELDGKTVRIQGKVVHLCGSGCSLTILDGDQKIKIRRDGDEFQFPADWKDKTVLVEGKLAADPGCGKHHGKGEAEGDEGDKDAAADAAPRPDHAPADHSEHAEHQHVHGEGAAHVIMATGAKLVE